MRVRFNLIVMIGLTALIQPLYAQFQTYENIVTSKKALLDSLLGNFTVEELAHFKEFYQNEIQKLEKEKKLLREKGIKDGEKLYAIRPDGLYMDKVLFRLAEFYYQKAEDKFFSDLEKYDKEFERYELGERDEPPEEPKPDYDRVIQTYQLILQKFPKSPLLDDVLYHLAFSYEKNNQFEKALPYYQQLVETYPQSANVPEALIRLGEYYFDPQHRNLDQAIQYYSKILDFKDTPRYDEAMYKLGWSFYLKEQFNQAIQMFTLLVQDLEKNVSLDPTNEYTNPSLKEEAVEYIGICFHDFGGLKRALAFIDSLGRPNYGVTILRKLGDIYRENEEKYIDAQNTYLALLERYPFDPAAPDIQENIVQCAIKLEDNQEIYLAQQELFEKYRPGSKWAEAIEKTVPDIVKRREILNNGFEKANLALQANINLAIKMAEESGDNTWYQLAVNNADQFLKVFPRDTSVYTIHWNMAVILDSKLHQSEKAYQAYLDICNNYVQDRFKKYAAQNAIVIARDLATQSGFSSDTLVSQNGLAVGDSAVATAATVPKDSLVVRAEERLIEAYNNFIMHFPHDQETAAVLNDVGIIYYNRKDFDNALVYFNTLTRRFPESPLSGKAQFTAMESYFGKKDFLSTEIMAKKVKQNADLPEELRQKAERRLAESIYLHAEALAGEGKHLEAATEFRRIIKEVPNAVFADKALFQAGVQYDKVKEFGRAIEMYSLLKQQFPQSEHYLDCINNLALDYGELENYQAAGQTYELLAEKHPDTTAARDALYNASYFYVKGEKWRDAIRVNRLYVSKYPDSPDAEDMFYNIAAYYLKLDDYEHANEIYGEFAAKYPNSPRSVETYFRRGDYFLEKGRIEDAFREFDLAVAKNKELKAKQLPANDFYAAEALFAKSQQQYKTYRQLRFTRNNFSINQQKKKDLLKQLVTQYQEVASLGTIRIYEAMYKIGRLYEDFADTWVNQEIGPMDESQKIVFLANLNKTASQLFERAFGSYKSSYKFLSELAKNYKPPAPDTSEGNSIKIVEKDSTLQVASRWINVIGAKTSEMLYKIAELNSNSIARFLSAPLPEGLDKVSQLEYRNQLLAKAVFPIIEQITRAHLRNLIESDSLKLANPWVERSQQKLTEVAGLLPQEYMKLCKDALELYHNNFDEYTRIMTSGTEEQQENAIDLAGKLINIIELSKNYATMVLANYKHSIDLLKENPLGNVLAQSLFSECVTATAELARLFVQDAETAGEKLTYFRDLNMKTPKMVYEDAIYTYSDGENMLRSNALSLCETAYELKKQYDFPAARFENVASLLIELDPKKYAEEFKLPVEIVKMAPDSTWLFSDQVADSSWMWDGELNDNWLPAHVAADSGGAVLLASNFSDSTVLDSTVLDSAFASGDSTGLDSLPPPAPGQFYVLKEFEISDVPVAATITINADDDVWVYVNGVEAFVENQTEIGWGKRFESDITEFLKRGKNKIAYKVVDRDRSGHGLQTLVKLKTISRQMLSHEGSELLNGELKDLGFGDINDMLFIRYIVPR